uniref:Uncharacterized protein n=1 Tax=Fagus sylvatica TaxID=28930 RepID=A0A2N9IJ43_FAGSY
MPKRRSGAQIPSRISSVRRLRLTTDLVRRSAIATNICVDQRGEPRSAPLVAEFGSSSRHPTLIREDPEFIPVGQVLEMAPPINPFRTNGLEPLVEARPVHPRRKARVGEKGLVRKARRYHRTPPRLNRLLRPRHKKAPRPLPVVHEIEESDHGEDLSPSEEEGKERGPSNANRRRPKPWLELKQIAERRPRPLLEPKRKTGRKAEVELAELREKVRKLESECIASIEKAIEDGKVQGRVEGEKSGYEGAMEEARTQFRMVYNTGFRKGWKSALTKTEQPETSELFLRSNTPIPYPEEGIQDSDNEVPEAGGEEEADDEDEEDGEVEEGTGTGRTQEAPQSVPAGTTADVPGPSSGK